MKTTSIVPALAAATAIALVSACGGSPEAEVVQPAEPLESYQIVDWAVDAQPTGTWVGAMESDALRLDVYQVGVAEAPEASGWESDDTGEPLFAAGDPVVALQYVVTTVAEEPVVLQNGEVTTTLRYDGSDRRSEPDEPSIAVALFAGGGAFAETGLASSPIDYDQVDSGSGYDLELPPGESASWAAVYGYSAGEQYTVSAEAHLVTDGEADYDTTAIDGAIEVALSEG
ncbi:hypothetical protein [Ruania alba]|uniref:Lipoprotein n=1 Tax=Ruania alba TaxID=648782 RepID=A0A1H5CMV5_9MICO|nr:hypothetical protein [Ruania alba]SED67993.1 hypothetical protein SAMN04488554_0419 [Ruania alba]